MEHEGSVYLFGNLQTVGSGALYLWVADSIGALPAAPVESGPRLASGARMAGGVLRSGGSLIRLGQDFRSDYGDGIFVFRIDGLSPTSYREQRIGELRFDGRRGPHTLNVGQGLVVFDWYQDRFSLLAGVRRMLALTGRPRTS